MRTSVFVLATIIVLMHAEVAWGVDESHPRLFLRQGEEKALLRNIKTDKIWSAMYDAILEECDTICGLPPQERVMTGPRMHGASCEVLRRVLFLSFAWRTTHNERYAHRAEAEMLHVAAFVDWHPSHFLDVAELAAAFGIGYDWLYDYLPQSSKQIIVKAIKEKALDPSDDDKLNAVFTTRESRKCNWGQVCNGGLTLAAIATLSENREQSSRIIGRSSMIMMDSMLAGYPPHGCFREGFGYWAFGTQYNILFIDAMERFFGPDSVKRHKEVPGFIESGYYSQQLITPSLRTFGYSDNSTRIYLEPAVMWFNKVSPSPEMFYRQKALFELFDQTHSYVKTIKNRLIPFMLIWGAGTGSSPTAHIADAQLPRKCFYLGKGDNDICVMRSGWGTDDAYLGFKAGRANNPHGHMDVGSFYYELDGVRWSIDLGSDDYAGVETHGLKLFDMQQQSDRWLRLTRYNNFAHSTTWPEGEYQQVDANCTIAGTETTMQVTTELSALYPDKVRRLERSLSLQGRSMLVEDKVEAANEDVTMVWNMTTEAQALTRSGNTLTLTAENGKRLLLEVECHSDFTAELVEATPVNSFENPITGVSFLRLRYKVAAGAKGHVRVKGSEL